MHAFLLVALSSPLVLCYDAKYDTIDVDKILADDKLLDSYINCIIEKGPCTLEHSEDFRQLFPEIASTKCGKCSDVQKNNLDKAKKAIKERKPAEWMAIMKKFYPKKEL